MPSVIGVGSPTQLNLGVNQDLQHIGKIDRPPEVVIFLHICTFGIFQVFSMYPNLIYYWIIYQVIRLLTRMPVIKYKIASCALPEAQFHIKLIFVLDSYCHSDSVVFATS